MLLFACISEGGKSNTLLKTAVKMIVEVGLMVRTIEMCLGMGNAEFPSLPWYSHGYGSQIV